MGLEGRIRRAEEVAAAFGEFKRQAALGARFARSGRALGEQQVAALEARGALGGGGRLSEDCGHGLVLLVGLRLARRVNPAGCAQARALRWPPRRVLPTTACMLARAAHPPQSAARKRRSSGRG